MYRLSRICKHCNDTGGMLLQYDSRTCISQDTKPSPWYDLGRIEPLRQDGPPRVDYDIPWSMPFFTEPIDAFGDDFDQYSTVCVYLIIPPHTQLLSQDFENTIKHRISQSIITRNIRSSIIAAQTERMLKTRHNKNRLTQAGISCFPAQYPAVSVPEGSALPHVSIPHAEHHEQRPKREASS